MTDYALALNWRQSSSSRSFTFSRGKSPCPAIRILVREGGHWRRITGDPPFLPTCGNFVQMVLHFLGKCMLINGLRLIYFYGTCCLLSTAQLTSYFHHRFASEENDKINMMEGRLEWLGWWCRDRFL